MANKLARIAWAVLSSGGDHWPQRTRLPHIVASKANSAAFLWRTELRLFCDLFQHEIRHDVGGLDGLGEGRVVPESVRKCRGVRGVYRHQPADRRDADFWFR